MDNHNEIRDAYKSSKAQYTLAYNSYSKRLKESSLPAQTIIEKKVKVRTNLFKKLASRLSFSSKKQVEVYDELDFQQIKSLLYGNQYVELLDLMSQGVGLPESLKGPFHSRLKNHIQENGVVFFEELFSKDIPIEQPYFIEFLLSLKAGNVLPTLINPENKQILSQKNFADFSIETHPFLSHFCQQKLKNPVFQKELFSYFYKHLETCSKTDPHHFFVHYSDRYDDETRLKYPSFGILRTLSKNPSVLDSLFLCVPEGDYLQCIHLLHTSIENIRKAETNTTDFADLIYFSHDFFNKSCLVFQNIINPMQENLRKFYPENGQNITSLKEKSIGRSKTITPVEIHSIFVSPHLPIEARQILDKIHQQYALIQHNSKHLSSSASFQVKNFFDKRMKEVVEAYLSLDIDFRQSDQHKQGKEPHTILISTLSNIEEFFVNVIHDINEQKLHSLNALHRYTNDVKNQYSEKDISNTAQEQTSDEIMEHLSEMEMNSTNIAKKL